MLTTSSFAASPYTLAAAPLSEIGRASPLPNLRTGVLTTYLQMLCQIVSPDFQEFFAKKNLPLGKKELTKKIRQIGLAVPEEKGHIHTIHRNI